MTTDNDAVPARPAAGFWDSFALATFRFDAFPSGSLVLDIGCGSGQTLVALRDSGVAGIGIDVDVASLTATRAQGLAAVRGAAEQLPFRAASIGGIVCKVALPYTDEQRAVAEMARVMQDGAEARLSGHGAGYYLRYIISPPARFSDVYGLRAILGTWWYVLTGRRLPGALGDTIYQSEGRLRSMYRQAGLELVESAPSKRFAGLPVFIYHRVRRVARPATAHGR